MADIRIGDEMACEICGVFPSEYEQRQHRRSFPVSPMPENSLRPMFLYS